jgi:hypothetical protein
LVLLKVAAQKVGERPDVGGGLRKLVLMVFSGTSISAARKRWPRLYSNDAVGSIAQGRWCWRLRARSSKERTFRMGCEKVPPDVGHFIGDS